MFHRLRKFRLQARKKESGGLRLRGCVASSWSPGASDTGHDSHAPSHTNPTKHPFDRQSTFRTTSGCVLDEQESLA